MKFAYSSFFSLCQLHMCSSTERKNASVNAIQRQQYKNTKYFFLRATLW